jgi:hypothetical protein
MKTRKLSREGSGSTRVKAGSWAVKAVALRGQKREVEPSMQWLYEGKSEKLSREGSGSTRVKTGSWAVKAVALRGAKAQLKMS